MIPIPELKEKAREFALPPSTIERDYAQNWLLKFLQTIPMALKGGTGIRKVFLENYRFSDDLDFTMQTPFDESKLREEIKQAVIKAREECGIAFSEDVEYIQTKNGLRARISCHIIPTRAGTPIKIQIDITSSENEEIFHTTQDRPIIHHYSDTISTHVLSYSLEEIMAEKIRSLFQRTHPRDLYDVWRLSKLVDKDIVKSIFKHKFEFKKMIPVIEHFIDNKEDFRGAWSKSLGHQMKDVPDFDPVFMEVTKEVEDYLN